MSQEPGSGASSRSLPLVLELGSAFDRCRLAVGGVIVSARTAPDEAGPRSLGFRCTLDDGSGQVDLLFLGRNRVPGLVVGARCHIEGTARLEHGRLTVWNPLYRLEPGGCPDQRLP